MNALVPLTYYSAWWLNDYIDSWWSPRIFWFYNGRMVATFTDLDTGKAMRWVN